MTVRYNLGRQHPSPGRTVGCHDDLGDSCPRGHRRQARPHEVAQTVEDRAAPVRLRRLDPVRMRAEDHVGAGIDHPMGLANLVPPRPRVELDAPMDHDDDEIRPGSRVPDGPQSEPEVVTCRRSGLLRTRDLVRRIEDLVDAQDGDRPPVDLQAGRLQRVGFVPSSADRDETRGTDLAQRVDQSGRSIVIGMVVRLARDVEAGAAGRRESSGVAPERERFGHGIHHIGHWTFQVRDGDVVAAEQPSQPAPGPAVPFGSERRDL